MSSYTHDSSGKDHHGNHNDDNYGEVGDPGVGGSRLERARELIRAGVGLLAGLERGELADPELGEVLVGLVGEQQLLAAGTAHVASVFEASGECRDSGLSLRSWLAWRCRVSPGDAGKVTNLARTLRDRPALDDALCAGEITLSHAHVLGGLARQARFRDAYADPETGEPVLLADARDLEFPEFEVAVDYWKNHADEDGTEKAAADDYEARSVELHDGLRGTGLLAGELTAPCRETVAEELDRLEHELFLTDWATAQEGLGRDPEVHELSRTTAQRRHDALERMATRSARPDNHAGKRPQPLLTVHLGQRSFTRLCELASGRQITPSQVLPYLGQAQIENILWDYTSRVLDVGQQRSFMGATRRAVQVKYRRCAWPGCNQPVSRCDVDHISPYSQGGPTDQLNGQPLCRRHNARKGAFLPDQLPEFDQPGRRADPRPGDGPGPGPVPAPTTTPTPPDTS